MNKDDVLWALPLVVLGGMFAFGMWALYEAWR